MGACFISDAVVAGSAREAWDYLYKRDLRMCGDDPYSGSFATCSFYGVSHTLRGNATKENIERAQALVDKHSEFVDKREARAIDVGISELALETVKAEKPKGRPSTKYVVIDSEGAERVYGSLADAKKSAEKIMRDSSGGRVNIQKRSVYPDGDSAILSYHKERRILKKTPKRVPKNAKLVERHLYLVYGWAAE